VRAETQDWEYQADAIECLNNGTTHQYSDTQRNHSASISSSNSEVTAFSDPFGGSKVGLNSDFVVLSRPSPTRSEHSLPSDQEVDTPVDATRERILSIRSATSPLISSPLSFRSDTLESDANADGQWSAETLAGKANTAIEHGEQRRNQRFRSATIASGETYPLETPLQTHRFNRRGAVVAADLPASPTAPDYVYSR